MTTHLSSRGSGLRGLPWFWVSVAILSSLAVFLLPLRFPPATPSLSVSYEVGFNNRVAALAAALISLSVALVLGWRNAGTIVDDSPGPMPRWWLSAASLVAVVHTGVIGSLAVRADTYYGDAGYFLTQMTHALYDHAHLYREIEFPYGPLLFSWPLSFARVLRHGGVTPEASYMVSLAVMDVLGFAVVFYILEKLPLSQTVRAIAFATLSVGSLTPILGLNYTMFRFSLPYAAILWIAESRTLLRQALLFGFAEICMLAVSPELGIALAAGAALYALYAAVTLERRRILLAFVPPIGFLLFAAWAGKDYFRGLRTFGIGGYNGVVDPTRGHIVILILATVALAPSGVAGYARLRGPHAAGLVGMYGASLVMLSSALGRCDALHTFFGGAGLAMLSLIGIHSIQGLWPKVRLTLFVFSALWCQATQTSRVGPDLRGMLRARNSIATFDLPRLEALTHGGRITGPIDLPPPLRRDLMRDGQYQPGYFCTMIQVTDAESEQAKVAEMRRAPYALLPVADYTLKPDLSQAGRLLFLNYGYKYKRIHPPYIAGALIQQEVGRNWLPVASFGGFELYRQKQ